MTQEIEQEALLPCPFCGSLAITPENFHLCCIHCGAEGPDADNREGRAAAWNRRAALSMKAPAEPVAWRYVLHGEDQDLRLVVSEDRLNYPFGKPGRDYSESYEVRETPLYAAQPPVDEREALQWARTLVACWPGHDAPTYAHANYAYEAFSIARRIVSEADAALNQVESDSGEAG